MLMKRLIYCVLIGALSFENNSILLSYFHHIFVFILSYNFPFIFVYIFRFLFEMMSIAASKTIRQFSWNAPSLWPFQTTLIFILMGFLILIHFLLSAHFFADVCCKCVGVYGPINSFSPFCRFIYIYL